MRYEHLALPSSLHGEKECVGSKTRFGGDRARGTLEAEKMAFGMEILSPLEG